MFFSLQIRLAVDISQKFTQYNMALTIIGTSRNPKYRQA
ncbi:DUF4180 domain-containing protein [Allomuricauda sp. F6463D]